MLTVSVVVPVYNAAPHLERVLAPLEAAVGRGEIDEIVLVDDSSSDASADLSRRRGLTVLASGGRLGPGACRNQGARAARGEVLLFIDSDVVVHDDVPARVRAALADPGVVAVFGSYDDRPAAPSVVSVYRNLLHHWVHQNGHGDALTFWAGCGAVRREAFLAAGGFDAERYARPKIEDIEFGYRLRRGGGRIRLDAAMQCTHLKRWTLGSMVHTDVFCRALPWSRLLIAGRHQMDTLNVARTERAKAVVAAALAAAVALTPLVPWLAPLAALLALLAWWVNRRFFALVKRRRGPLAMLGALALHQLYYLYSSATYAWCLLEARLGLARRA